MRRLCLLWLGLLPACASEEPSPAPTPITCVVEVSEQSGLDGLLEGNEGCPGRLALRLRVATGDPAAPTWHDAATAPLQIRGEWSSSGSAATREVRVENPGDTEVRLVGLEWSTGDDGLGFPADRMLHQGYQSWSYTGIEPIPATLSDALGTAQPGGADEDVTGERPGVSWWQTALVSPEGRGLVIGADGGTVLRTFVAADGATPRLRLVQGMENEALTIPAGGSRTLDGLFVALGDASGALEQHASRVAAAHSPALPRHPALGGWGSWNLYYTKVDASTLRQEASWASKTLAPLGLTDFLLDDGYEPRWGEWSASAGFGAELSALNAELKTQGLRPALWLAPAYVAQDSAIVSEHPDWFVHDADGSLHQFVNAGTTHVPLDITHPEARAHVQKFLKDLMDWGYQTLKIDFLFGASVVGVRQGSVTSLESYQLWMKTIREAVPQAHLVGCGAPLWPSVGWVDSMRTGPDVAFETSPVARWNFLGTQARHTAMRGPTDAWWAIDPDVVILRGDAIDDQEAWTFLVSSAMAGGNWLSGDGQQASDLRRSWMLDTRLQQLTRDGRAARPEALFEGMDGKPIASPILAGNAPVEAPHVWRKTSADNQHGAVAVFAWDTEGFSRTISLPPGAEELSPGENPLRSEPAGGTRVIEVAPHRARLFVW